jgi:tRNA (guanine-N7-)-methyltransferase
VVAPIRTVRSFARRGGHLSTRQKQALTTLWPRYVLDAGSSVMDLDLIFSRRAARIMEIGFGMGDCLLAQAQQKPENDFIGIDVHRAGIGTVLAAIAECKLNNIRLFCADAVEVLRHCLPDSSLDQAQLFFPDPWPKRRHHKRRLVQPAFIELIRQKLKPQGIFYLATDWQEYAEQMLAVLSAHPGFINSAGENQFAPRCAERPLTKFEQRGKNLGHEVWDLIFVKK